MTVRRAELRDAAAIAPLTTELGYPTDSATSHLRLTRLLPSERDAIFVAESDGRVIGWIHVSVVELLETDRHVVINGLVVGEAFRSRGAGILLLQAGEAWAREQGVDRIRVRSNIIRERAHRFYEREGYGKTKQSFTLEKRF